MPDITMRIVCLSDTHGLHRDMTHPIPDGDVLVFAGDLCGHGEMYEVKAFARWMGKLPHEHKIVVAGNHDWPFSARRIPLEQQHARAYIEEIAGAVYLNHEAAQVATLSVFGSPWTPQFGDWAFMYRHDAITAEARWNDVPEGLDLLITHGPPKGILDRTVRGDFAGCDALRNRAKKARPRLHVFGHIHEAYGTTTENGTQYVNASVCNIRYEPINAPVVVDL